MQKIFFVFSWHQRNATFARAWTSAFYRRRYAL